MGKNIFDTALSIDGAKGVLKVSHQNSSSEENEIEEIIDAVNQGITLKEIHGISEEQMDGLYNLAYELYNQGRLDEAEKFFKFLCIYDFYSVDFLMGLAAVYQLKELYQKASDIYAVAFAQSDLDYRPMLYLGQCQLALGKLGRAGQCFKSVIDHTNDEALRLTAEAYLSVLRKTRSSGTV